MRSTKSFLWPSFFLFIIAFSSCQPIYRPSVTNQPLMSSQGDIQASGHFGTNGADAQLAGAVTNNILLTAGYSAYSREEDSDSASDVDRKHSIVEIGAGYYRHIGKGVRSTDNSGAVVELIGGYGNGKASNYSNIWTNSHREVTGQYHKLYFQPGIGYHHDVFDGGFASRITAIDYYDVRVKDGQGSVQPTTSSGFDVFFEPAFTGRVGYRFVKFQFQAGLSIPVQSEPLYNYQPFMFSVGIHFDISRVPD